MAGISLPVAGVSWSKNMKHYLALETGGIGLQTRMNYFGMVCQMQPKNGSYKTIIHKQVTQNQKTNCNGRLKPIPEKRGAGKENYQPEPTTPLSIPKAPPAHLAFYVILVTPMIWLTNVTSVSYRLKMNIATDTSFYLDSALLQSILFQAIFKIDKNASACTGKHQILPVIPA